MNPSSTITDVGNGDFEIAEVKTRTVSKSVLKAEIAELKARIKEKRDSSGITEMEAQLDTKQALLVEINKV